MSIGLFEFGGMLDFDRVSFNTQSRYGYFFDLVSREAAKARRKRRVGFGSNVRVGIFWCG
jgi:hypothetical protein